MFEKTLYGLDKKDGFKVWKIVVREYLDPVVDTHQVVIEVFHGKDGGKVQKKVEFVHVGKQGRTPYEQGVSQAEGKIKKQVDKGYRESKEELEELPLLPMLAGDYNKIGHRIKFPCYVSDKFDGVRCLATCVIGAGGEKAVILQSRTGQPYDVPHISLELAEYMGVGDVFDGEIYLHGYELQEITSAVKRTDTQAEVDKAKKKHAKSCTAAGLQQNPPDYEARCEQEVIEALRIHKLRPLLEFHVFDIPGELDFLSRYLKVCELHVATRHSDVIFAVGHSYIGNEREMFKAHADAVARGYEGIMLRNFSGMYESGKRSADLQKYKEFLDSEFKVLDVIPDKDGHGVLVVQNDVADNTFTVVIGSHDERVWQLANKHLLIGLYLTVKYQSRYKGTLIPQFPTGVAFRSCDAEGNPIE